MSAAVQDQLRKFIDDSILRRNTYWKMYYAYGRYNNFLSIPLLLLSSVTGITSVSQASNSGNESNKMLLWITAAMGTGSTFLAAVQRYFRYGERAEHCKNLAKAYGDLARRIEITLDIFEDGGSVDLHKFAEEVVQEMRKLLIETEDMPESMLEKERSHEPMEPLRVSLNVRDN
jgi:hypothetical protein